MRYGSLLILIAAVACQNSDHEAKTEPTAKVTYTEDGEPVGLHRFKKWSDKLYQGAQPVGDEAFRNLAALGVTTVISVDGAATDVDTAHKYGITYAHCPIGYDGVPRDQALLMIRAAQNSKGAVYVHCHHGKHRGPAGMMAIRIATEGLDNAEAVEDLKNSGTSPKYEGLYKDVSAFKAPTKEEMAKVPATVPERVMPEGMRALMVSVSHRWEFIKSSRSQEWGVPKESPDVSPPHEARMLWELYRESARTGDWKKYGEDFKEYLVEGEQAAIELEKALRAKDLAAAEKHYKVLKANCNSCHSQYRN
ncbi:MAG: cytochrome c [Planctomycetota bacterium]|jgi:protein tyrosine phosphatase (PTP) superfamily phosphohydrolase (DUF442 family)